MTGEPDPYGVALRVLQTLEALGIAGTVGGSIASSFAGEPRSTIDIDIVAAIEERHVRPIVAALTPEFYLDEDALRRAVLTRTSVNAIHQETLLKVDLFVAGGTPLDALQLARRQRVTVADGRVLHVHPPEDIVLQKLRWYRLGGEASDRQWRDLLAIVRVQGHRLDREYLRQHAPTLGVADLLSRLLASAD